MEDIYLWLIILSVLFLTVGLSYWAIKTRVPKTPEVPEQKITEKPLEPEVQVPVERPKKKISLSKAISAWLPLLQEKSKDRSRWEEALIMSDMGPQLTQSLLEGLEKTEKDPKEYFKASLKQILRPAKSESKPWNREKPWVLMIVGVNGVGKTTSLVKLGRFFKDQGSSTGVIGADTFRKAAIEQLERGCQKNALDFFSYKVADEASEGADPAAVLFDGLKKFAEKDVILVDTSGRLHTKRNLMDELSKMKKVAGKASPGAPQDIWIVLDATLGQNALQQAKVFHEAVGLTGIILTKLDGLSRGGSVFELYRQLSVPIWFLGMGEQAEDLQAFDPEIFVEELFDDQASRSIG